MADKEMGALTVATTLGGTELAHVVQGANSRKVTTSRVVGEVTHAAAGKTTPVDADELGVIDSAASNVLKKLLWSNVKATLKTYLDTIYEPVGGGGPTTIELSMFAGGKPTASETLFRHEFTAAATIPAALAGSQGSAGVAATASTVLTLKKNTTSIGTATWAAAGTEPTLAAASPTSFAIGDVLVITAPATPDATLADISLSIVGSI
jgi:hypothetical protein